MAQGLKTSGTNRAAVWFLIAVATVPSSPSCLELDPSLPKLVDKLVPGETHGTIAKMDTKPTLFIYFLDNVGLISEVECHIKLLTVKLLVS